MVRIESNLEEPLVPIPLPQAGTLSSRTGCSMPIQSGHEVDFFQYVSKIIAWIYRFHGVY